MPSLTVVRRALAVLVLAAGVTASATAASAHAALVSSDPEDGATVTELTTIHLEFSEELLDIGSTITLVDAAGTETELEVTHPEPTVLEAEVTNAAPGDLTIEWRSASVDGHTEEGELRITLLAPEPSPTPTVTVTVTATPSPSATPSATPTPSATADNGSESGVSPWVWGLLGLVVIGGAGAALIAATRRPPTED